MTLKDKDYVIVDQAWDSLYKRLVQDDLIHTNKRTFRYTTLFRAAAVAVLLSVCIGWYMMSGSSEEELLVLSNEANAPTLAKMLEDGSVVYLSEQSLIKYPDGFDSNKREVTLHGEAFFEVKKQIGRPFLINTESAKIEVIGTSFSIKSHSPFMLSVRSGEVRVTQKGERRALTAKAGETVRIHNGKLQLVNETAVSFDDYFNRIQFKDERLGNVADIINMRSELLRLKVGADVEDRLLTITVSGNNTAGLAEMICWALKLEQSQTDNIIHISQKK